MKIKLKDGTSHEVTVISICGKTSDMCDAMLKDKDGNGILHHDGYVPDYFPGEHYGDYIMLDIELATGRILNWKAPTEEQVQAWINRQR